MRDRSTLWVRVALWGLLTTVAVTTAGLAWARTTRGPLQTGTVVASASAEEFDRTDRSLGGPSGVVPGEASRGLSDVAPAEASRGIGDVAPAEVTRGIGDVAPAEVSKPVLVQVRATASLVERISEEAVVSVRRLDDPPSGVSVGIGDVGVGGVSVGVGDVGVSGDVGDVGVGGVGDVGIGDVGERTVDTTPGAGSDAADQRAADQRAAGQRAAGQRAADQPSTSGETTYTYWDGDAEITVWLVPQTVTPDVEPEDAKAASKSGSGAEQNRRSVSGTGPSVPSGQLVFRTATGSQMWLPGGVVLVLDAAWSTAQTDAFFARNGIEADRVTEFDWLDNGFSIESGPGLASLELANRLVGQQGVVLSSPDWSVEAELK